MTNKNSLHNVVALNQFSTLTEDEMITVEGGMIVIGYHLGKYLANKFFK